jgi:hypothetical protein
MNSTDTADLSAAPLDPACAIGVTAVMTCKAVSSPPFDSSLVAGIVSAGTVLLLLMLLVHLSFKRLGRIKRQLEWWRKHLAGMPKCGEMSIVVTDIEGYSGGRPCCHRLSVVPTYTNIWPHTWYNKCEGMWLFIGAAKQCCYNARLLRVWGRRASQSVGR